MNPYTQETLLAKRASLVEAYDSNRAWFAAAYKRTLELEADCRRLLSEIGELDEDLLAPTARVSDDGLLTIAL